MSVKVATVMQTIEKIAPKKLAYEWDNVGLIIGNPAQEIDTIMVALDINEGVVLEAIKEGVGLIISHHPLIFKPLKSIRWDSTIGSVIKLLIQNEINVYSAHTNLDIAEKGVNHILFEKLGLKNKQILKIEGVNSYVKFVVFVPLTHTQQVKTAMGDAGAGWIGNYSHCTFSSKGIGSFKPLEGTKPFIGTTGEIQKVEEIRIETIIPEKMVNQILKAVIKAHPYEEVAYDIYPLKNLGEEFGLGLIGNYSKSFAKDEFLKMVKERLKVPFLKIAGELPKLIDKVAVCGGSGGNMISAASFRGAQVLITGDVSYHQGQEAENIGLCVIDAGHGNTEKPVIPYFAELISQELKNQKRDVKVIISKINSDPWLFL